MERTDNQSPSETVPASAAASNGDGAGEMVSRGLGHETLGVVRVQEKWTRRVSARVNRAKGALVLRRLGRYYGDRAADRFRSRAGEARRDRCPLSLRELQSDFERSMFKGKPDV